MGSSYDRLMELFDELEPEVHLELVDQINAPGRALISQLISRATTMANDQMKDRTRQTELDRLGAVRRANEATHSHRNFGRF